MSKVVTRCEQPRSNLGRRKEGARYEVQSVARRTATGKNNEHGRFGDLKESERDRTVCRKLKVKVKVNCTKSRKCTSKGGS